MFGTHLDIVLLDKFVMGVQDKKVKERLSIEDPSKLTISKDREISRQVSKEEYDTCRITNPNPRIIAICDKPYKLMYFTITFRSFTPQPGGLEFQPGQDYYFISHLTPVSNLDLPIIGSLVSRECNDLDHASTKAEATSSKDDLHRRIGGRCSSHNMKVVFKVCCRPDLNLSCHRRQVIPLIILLGDALCQCVSFSLVPPLDPNTATAVK
uniref:Ephrin RBD domain-containing protein n=1 Tax=Timema genevievae TaxID=629358 RepID=A0A7R9K7T8_TIMGE|nr:unnamed protein product [Timema genevievae]